MTWFYSKRPNTHYSEFFQLVRAWKSALTSQPPASEKVFFFFLNSNVNNHSATIRFRRELSSFFLQPSVSEVSTGILSSSVHIHFRHLLLLPGKAGQLSPIRSFLLATVNETASSVISFVPLINHWGQMVFFLEFGRLSGTTYQGH